MANPFRVPGKVKPTWFDAARTTNGRSDSWRFPNRNQDRANNPPGLLLCPRCHAISEFKRWYVDEERYQALRNQPQAQFVTCPGCERIDRQMFDGEVVLRSPFLAKHREEALRLLYNTEGKARTSNPFARLASIDDRGDEIHVLTITQWLAERIGKEFHKSFAGDLTIQRLPQERFSRVYWERAA